MLYEVHEHQVLFKQPTSYGATVEFFLVGTNQEMQIAIGRIVQQTGVCKILFFSEICTWRFWPSGCT